MIFLSCFVEIYVYLPGGNAQLRLALSSPFLKNGWCVLIFCRGGSEGRAPPFITTSAVGPTVKTERKLITCYNHVHHIHWRFIYGEFMQVFLSKFGQFMNRL